MPELPEVETTRRGIAPHVEGRLVTAVVVRHHGMRWPVPRNLSALMVGRTIERVDRRAKYLLFKCGANDHLIVHLGMSGSLRLVAADAPAGPHDHFDLRVGASALRLHDPRRFGAVLWHSGSIDEHPLIGHLGVEPLSAQFDGPYLFRASRKRAVGIKTFLMNHAVVVGVGNIYASESLFRARIRPTRHAARITRAQCDSLASAIKATLTDAIAAGGSTLRDFVASDGNPGYFQVNHFVYDRAGEPCRVCGTPIRRLVQGQRSSFYCPMCQRG
jgi:formamidopyrimidine-DNA glycosylase